MSAKLFSIESLLIGKRYNSQSVSGVIVNAEKSDRVYYNNADTYLVQVQEDGGFIYPTYRYVAVQNGDF